MMNKAVIAMLAAWACYAQAYALEIDPVKIRLLEGDYKSAIAQGEKLLAHSSRDSRHIDELYYVLGISYMKDGNLLRASDIFEIIIKEHKNSPFKEEAMMGLGDTHLLRGDICGAKEVYERLLKQNPQTKLKSQLFYRLSQAGFKKGELEDGKVYLAKIREQAPLTPELKDDEGVSALPADLSGLCYSVQVGAFSKPDNAQNLVKRLNAKDYPAYIEESGPPQGAKYRVKVGRFTNRDEAEKLQKRLSAEGYPTKLSP